MKTVRKLPTALMITVGSAMALSYMNCSPAGTSFSSGQNAQSSAAGATGGGTTTGGGSGGGFCVPSGTTTGSGASGNASNGLVATKILYVPSGQSTSAFTSFGAFVNGAQGVLNENLYLSSINLPNVYFSSGFKGSSGNVLRANDGTVLSQYFAFEASGYIGLGGLAPGDYQIASLTDDGSILRIKGGSRDSSGNPTDLVINNDGAHSLEMGCASQLLHLDASSRYPVTFDYFQGAPTTIGMMVMIRPVPAGNAAEPQCGQGGGNDGYFFDDHSTPGQSVPQQPYKDLLSRGWQVMPEANYQLPDTSGPLPCAKSQPGN